MKQYKIYNDREPKKWLESLLVGNGRMGATLMCGKDGELLYLNEETIWSSKEG